MRTSLLLLSLLCASISMAQSTKYTIEKHKSINLSEVKIDWATAIIPMEAPNPDGDSYKDYLEKVKKGQEPKSVHQKIMNRNWSVDPDSMVVVQQYEGNEGAGMPDDHTIAISNDGIVMTGMNSNILITDAETGEEIKSLSMVAFSDSLELPETRVFDPKVIYHPEFDRFIFCYLHSSKANNNKIIFAFSQTNDPSGDWNTYLLPGHKDDTTYWSDYPALGISDSEVFLTLNYIQEGVSWQEGFRGSIVWQIDIEDGIKGNGLNARLWDPAQFEGNLVRNMHPVSGGSGPQGPNMYFLSNKNFSPQCDSIFLIEITNQMDADDAEMTVSLLQSETPYGLAPNAYQSHHMYSGEYHRFSTNDSRVLGAFIENNKIQFVGNSIRFTDSTASFFHGFIDDITQDNPKCNLQVIEDTIEFGYPNISYAGNGSNHDAIITFNHSSKTVHSGFSALFYKTAFGYTTRQTVKAGKNYVNVISGTSERWGDYTGSQRKYNEPGVVWTCGSFGTEIVGQFGTTKNNGTWIAALHSPDTLTYNIAEQSNKTKAISTFPNPFINRIVVEFEMPKTSVATIEIYNINGQLVKRLYQDKVSKGTNQLSFSDLHLKTGTYILEINADDQLIMTKKILKN